MCDYRAPIIYLLELDEINQSKYFNCEVEHTDLPTSLGTTCFL